MQKIKSLTINGFRGVKDPLVLPLNERSGLFYGENGTGKSTVADAIEWFYYDRVKHLSSSEIDKNEALRNINLTSADPSNVSLGLTKSTLNSDKTLAFVKTKLISSFSNSSTEFGEYKEKSLGENLLLRYRDLEDFVCSSKAQKLETLSGIIGYSEVIKTRTTIRNAFNAIKNEIRAQGFVQQQNTQQRLFIEKLGANIYTEVQLLEKINEIIQPLKLGVTAIKISDLDSILAKLKSPVDGKVINDINFLEKCDKSFKLLKLDVPSVDVDYQNFFEEFEKIFKDVESIKQVLFKDLLETGHKLVSSKNFESDNCPLCLQNCKVEDLKKELEKRLAEIETSSVKLKELEKARNLIKATIEERIRRIDHLFTETLMSDKRFVDVKKVATILKTKLNCYLDEISLEISSGKMVKPNTLLKLDDSDFMCQPALEELVTGIKKLLASDNVSDARVKIEFAKSAFEKVIELNKELANLENQKESISLILFEFIKKQREGLESFIQTLSGEINEYFQFMNPSKHFKDLEIVLLDDDDGELEGITIQFKFNGSVVSPPKKYFSESYLNCYGIAFFLASVKAFNKKNKFFVLDDVISSFDSEHRKRFADLLFEKFADYQIIVLTHETEWFGYIKDLAKGKGWEIQEVKWSPAEGTHLEKSPANLRELIDYQIANNIVDQLGNSIRIYLEKFLKQVCVNLEIRTVFRFNDQNEKRMCPELLNELRPTVEKKSTDFKAYIPLLERLAGTSILGNLLSHDNRMSPKMGDLKAAWEDVKSIEAIFTCPEETCGKLISTRDYDTVKKQVRCRCGALSYNWK